MKIVPGSDGTPLNVLEFETYAKEYLPKNAYDYYASGADDMVSLRENREAFKRLTLRPRVLRDVSNMDISTTVLGQRIATPVCIAPTAMQRMAHPDGEIASSGAAAKTGNCFILSTISTTNLEDVAASNGDGLRWFQLYVFKDRKLTRDLVLRAEKAGYKAIVLTVDTPMLGHREPDVRNHFSLPKHLELANFAHVGGEHAHGVKSLKDSGLAQYVGNLFDLTLNWEDVKWLKSITKLPVVVKGVLTGEDAKLAVEMGCEAILVSNHGARQLDGVSSTIEALPEIIEAVKGRAEVYMDGGVRRGTDVFKALALGARAVFIGRPVLWGLSHSGEKGVLSVLRILNDELKHAMLFAGTARLADIKYVYFLFLTPKLIGCFHTDAFDLFQLMAVYVCVPTARRIGLNNLNTTQKEDRKGNEERGMEGLTLKNWKLGKKLGAGACSDVYAVEPMKPVSAEKGVCFVMKVSPIPEIPAAKAKNKKRKKTPAERNADALYAEYLVYQSSLRDHARVPRLPDGAYGEDKGYRFLVLERLGRTLETVLQEEGPIPSATAARLGVEILDTLQHMHVNNIIYVDVKPENFMVDTDKESKVYCLDFGISDRYVMATGKHKDHKVGNIVGTPTFLSLNCHAGATPSRRDDIEALLNVLVYLQLGNLPWQKASSDAEGAKVKKATTVDQLCSKLPAEWKLMLKKIRATGFEDKPDYDFFAKQFTKLGGKLGSTDPYNWGPKSSKKTSLDAGSSTPTASPATKKPKKEHALQQKNGKTDANSPQKEKSKGNGGKKGKETQEEERDDDEDDAEVVLEVAADPRRRRKAAQRAVAGLAAATAAAKQAEGTSTRTLRSSTRS